VRFSCTNCGPFRLSGTAIAILPRPLLRWRDRAKVSRWIRLNGNPNITNDDLRRLVTDLQDISVPEQMDNVIYEIGERFDSASDLTELDSYKDLALVGAPTAQDLSAISSSLFEQKLIEGPGNFVQDRIGDYPRYTLRSKLTANGWKRFQDLRSSKVESRIGFMALPFGDANAVQMLTEVYRPAVIETGFVLHSLLDDAKAGLIDEKLKVALRRSAFVIAEITTQNSNVLWEAGFAEGLSKPVIYSCKKDKWAEVKEHTFDTNHMHTIIWNPDDRQAAAERLKATLRDTFPSATK
jgi:hypothetical protein